MRPESDYSDKCTKLQNIIETNLDERNRIFVQKSLVMRTKKVKEKFRLYMKYQTHYWNNPNAGTVELVLDVLQKILLSYLLYQPDHWLFVRELKLEFLKFQ